MNRTFIKILLPLILFHGCQSIAQEDLPSIKKFKVSVLIHPDEPNINTFYINDYEDVPSNVSYMKLDNNYKPGNEFEVVLMKILESSTISELKSLLYESDINIPNIIANSLYIENVYLELHRNVNLEYRNVRYKVVDMKYVSPLLEREFTDNIKVYFIENKDKSWKIIGIGEEQLSLVKLIKNELRNIFSIIYRVNLKNLQECFDSKTENPIAKRVYEETASYQSLMKSEPNMKRFMLYLSEWEKNKDQQILEYLYEK